MSKPEEQFNIQPGFEAVHDEWLSQGGREFRKTFYESPNRRYYASQYWKLLKQAVFNRDSKKCFRCEGLASQIHHLCYDFTGEEHLHPEVLVSVCKRCHSLAEYARRAESIIRNIDRRKYFLTKAIESDVYVYLRLLEYRSMLARFRRSFESAIPYKNPPLTPDELKNYSEHRKRELLMYEQQARAEINSWGGTKEENVRTVISELDKEIENCRAFAQMVFKPVPR